MVNTKPNGTRSMAVIPWLSVTQIKWTVCKIADIFWLKTCLQFSSQMFSECNIFQDNFVWPDKNIILEIWTQIQQCHSVGPAVYSPVIFCESLPEVSQRNHLKIINNQINNTEWR